MPNFVRKLVAASLDAGRELHHRYVYERPNTGFRESVARAAEPVFLEHAEQFCRDGVLILPRYFNGDVLDAMRGEFDAAMRPRDGADGRTDLTSELLLQAAALTRSAVDPYLVALSAYYWGKPVCLAQATGNRIEPLIGDDPDRFKAWHHDTKRKQVKTMLLLTETPSDGQRMDYIPGTHLLWHASRVEGSHSYQNPEATWGKAIPCSGPAGTVVIFDTNGIHRPNRNSGPRRDIWVNSYTAGKYLFPIKGVHPGGLSGIDPRRRALLDLSSQEQLKRLCAGPSA